MSVSTPHRIIIDCDPGHDDMAAILLAASHPAITIEAITTVCGNASLENTTRNALRIVDAFGLDVPVHAGAVLPLLHRYEFPAAFHGPSGMDSSGVELPQTERQADAVGAVEAIIAKVDANPGEITLVVIGPMTNIALALALRPDLAQKVRQIVFMGGSATEGNVTPAAEFNIWADAEAARMVFRSGAKLVMFGLNLTHQTLLSRKDVAEVRAAVTGDNPVADIMAFYCGTYYAFAGEDKPGAPLHDPCAVAYLLAPEIFGIRQLPGEVIVDNGPGYGQTLIDFRPQDPKHDQRVKNVGVAMTVDAQKFTELVTPGLVWGAKRFAAKA